MGLLVLAVLQGVFDPSQEAVGAFQAPGVVRLDQAGLAFGVQRGQQASLLQRRRAAAAYQLRELDHELDLADAAFAQFDVVGLGGLFAPAVVRTAVPVLAYALAQRAQRRQGVEVEILAVDEGTPQRLQLRRLGGGVAALEGLGLDAARLQPGIAFPFPALRDQVVLEGVQAPGQRSGVAIGPQPQVGAEDVAVGVDLGDDRHHAPRQPAVELVVGNGPAPVGLALVAVQHDQVDVGRDVQFLAAQLAHAHDQHFLGQAEPFSRGIPCTSASSAATLR